MALALVRSFRTASGLVIKSRCRFRYLSSTSLRFSYSGSMCRQGASSLTWSAFRDSSPFMVTKAFPLAPTMSPRLMLASRLSVTTCSFVCSSRMSRKVCLPCFRIELMRPATHSSSGARQPDCLPMNDRKLLVVLKS